MKRPTIVVGTDFSRTADLAVEAAAAITHRTPLARLVVAHVIPEIPIGTIEPYSYTDDQIQVVRRRAEKFAHQKLDALVFDDHLTVDRMVRRGSPARVLADIAHNVDAEMVVVATHGMGAFRRAVLGSVSNSLIRVAECPVLVVGEERAGVRAFQHVVAAIDLSDVSTEVIRRAVRTIVPSGQLTVISYYEPPLYSYAEPATLTSHFSPEAVQSRSDEHRKAVQSIIDEAKLDDLTVRIETRAHATPALAILDFIKSNSVDICVLGTSGHNAWHRFFLGSTATRVIAEAPCPTLVVPHQVLDKDGLLF